MKKLTNYLMSPEIVMEITMFFIIRNEIIWCNLDMNLFGGI